MSKERIAPEMILGSVKVEDLRQKSQEKGWIKQLGLGENDPAVEKLRAVAGIFKSLKLSLNQLSLEERREESERLRMGHQAGEPGGKPDFRFGVHYFFGKYNGEPRSTKDNAANAIYEGTQGVELWRVMKSVAFQSSDNNRRLVVAHLRGDRQIDEEALFGISKKEFTHANLGAFGLEYGVVNPFIRPPANVEIEHIFDRDLIDTKGYPGNDFVLTSSGDPRFYVGFDIRRYLQVTTNIAKLSHRVLKINDGTLEKERILARHPVEILGGDSAVDTASIQGQVAEAVVRELTRQAAFFGDRSVNKIVTTSDPNLGSSLNAPEYARRLRDYVRQKVQKLALPPDSKGPLPIVTFSSMTMHGVAGSVLRDMRGIIYIGPKEALEPILHGLGNLGGERGVAHTILLGLPSAYDKRYSAFAGDILNMAVTASPDILKRIKEFVTDCKEGRPEPTKLYNEIVGRVLREVSGNNNLDALKGRTMAVILGASELESFVSGHHRVPGPFEVIKSSDSQYERKIAGTVASDKIRLILVLPGQAIAEKIARTTIESVSS